MPLAGNCFISLIFRQRISFFKTQPSLAASFPNQSKLPVFTWNWYKKVTEQTTQIPVSSIILDEAIYPRKDIDHKRVGIFAENIRDGIAFDPIEVESCPDKPGFYRHLDGVHRWSAYKSTGVEAVKVIKIDLDGNDPLLYAAEKAIGPKQLTEEGAKDTARRAYAGNTCLSSADIGKAIGRSRQAVDPYIADLRAVNLMGRDIKTFCMHRLGIPQDRIAKRLGLARTSFQYHLPKMAALPNSANADLRVTFRLSQRFSPVVVSAMQKKGILGVISRYVIVLNQNN